jgi:transcriptional regulator with XRE-family HTH domain
MIDRAESKTQAEMGERISHAIEFSEKSQRQIADEVGVTKQAVTNWKKGKIGWDAFIKLAETLGLEPAELLPPPDDSDNNKKKLMSSYDSLGPRERDMLVQLAESWAGASDEP